MNFEALEIEIKKKNFKFWHMEDFDQDEQETNIVRAMPESEEFSLQRTRIRKDINQVNPELKEFFCEPLLDGKQEQHMFKRYNYYKYKAYKFYNVYLNNNFDSDKDKAVSYFRKCLDDRNFIVRCNTRLAAKIVKKRKDFYGDNIQDLMSDCFYNIIKAVDGFDYRRGFKFSTYCMWVLMNNTLREHGNDKKFYDNFSTNVDTSFFSEKVDENNFNSNISYENMEGIDHDIKKVLTLIKEKDEREYFVLVNCFGLDGKTKKTLKEISKELNLTKERVRQIRENTIKYVKDLVQTGDLDLSVSNF